LKIPSFKNFKNAWPFLSRILNDSIGHTAAPIWLASQALGPQRLCLVLFGFGWLHSTNCI
jgi:hypothetical protein